MMKTLLTRRALIVGFVLTAVLAFDPIGMSQIAPALANASELNTETREEQYTRLLSEIPDEQALDSPAMEGAYDALETETPEPVAEDVALPEPAEASVSLDESVTIDVGGLELTVGETESSPSMVDIAVADQAAADEAGVDGVLLTVSDSSGEATPDSEIDLTVSYADFADLNGGDWASRLRMVYIPDCSETELGDPACAVRPLHTVNDVAAQTVQAVVPVETVETGATMASLASTYSTAAGTTSSGSVGVTAGTSSQMGNWGATSFAPTSSWGTTGSTGAFTWSHPVPAPEVPAGPAPELAISYASAAADGRTPSTNNQSGWIGEGFDITSGYVERSYVPCMSDRADGATNANRVTGDLCWGKENATLVFNGGGAELVRDQATGRWRSKNDDGSRVELLTGAWNDGEAKEYWKVTTTDGSQYFFGRGKRTAEDTRPSNSAWTVPVYGNHPSDRCYKAANAGGYAASRCDQVWRWNLEYVVDPSGNSMSYFYSTEKNYYTPDYYVASYNSTTPPTAGYTSGGFLERIEYGTRAGSDTTGNAPAKIEFTTAPRCVTDINNPRSLCAPGETGTDTKKWPDTPRDLICASTKCDNPTPAFFDRTRLSKISTWANDGSTYQPIESWTLGQHYVGGGPEVPIATSKSVMLTLDTITHTAFGGTATTGDDITMPTAGFAYTFLDNRVDAQGDNYDAMVRPRVTNVRTDSGASISVNYRAECTPGNVPATTDTAQRDNNKLCFPVKWTPDNASTPVTHYFHKYVVASMVEAGSSAPSSGSSELITGSLATQTAFTYNGGAKWVKPTGSMIKPEEVTYSDFRGFDEVITTVGSGSEASSTSTRYFRGSGATLTAGPTGYEVSAVDDERFAGQPFVVTELNGTAKLSQTITVPATPVITATSATGLKSARIPGTTTSGFSFKASGALEHRTRTVNSMDGNGQLVSVDDQGDLTDSADDKCTTVTYAHQNQQTLADKNIVTLAARTEIVAKACGAPVSRPADVIADDRATYDDSGRSLRSERLDPVDGDGTVLTSEIRQLDERGRPLRIADAAGSESTVTYTHSAGGLLQSTSSTSPDPDGWGPLSGFTTTSTFNPLLGVLLSSTDANGKVTSGTYDSLRRLLTVRSPEHQASAKPSVEYSYLVQADPSNNGTGLNSVVTKTLGADGKTQHASAVFYDGLLRPFQDQRDGQTAGETRRMVSHSYYDSAGRLWKDTGEWVENGTINGIPVSPTAVPPSLTTTVFDAAARPTAKIFWVGNESNPLHEKWRTTIAYDGATTLQIPPTGGVPTATVTDARGRNTEMREYLRPQGGSQATPAAVRSLPKQSTSYRYDSSGQMVEMRDPASNVWSYTFDWGGRQTSAVDPDGGTTTSTYDELDRVKTKTNANGQTLAYTYDVLSRPTTLRDGSQTGNIRAEWRYDASKDTSGKAVLGQLTDATRIVDGKRYVTSTTVYDDAYRPVKSATSFPDIPELSQLASRTFENAYGYTADGQPSSLTLPAVADKNAGNVLGGEIVTTRYDGKSMPQWMGGGFGWGVYAAQSTFATDGRPTMMDIGNTYGTYVSYEYEEGTNRLTNVGLKRQQVTTGREVNLHYSYDDAGNVLSLMDKPLASHRTGAAYEEQQCFTYDPLRRLKSAWTEAPGTCSQTFGTSMTLSGPAPYAKSFEYDALGNRTKQTSLTKNATGTGLNATTTTYSYGGGSAGPHALTATTTKDAAGNTLSTDAYQYDAAGNRTSRVGQNNQTLIWDAEGELTEATGAKSVYDASGNRILRTDSTGTTIYLPSGQEVMVSSSGVVSAARHYSFAGQTVAVRTGKGLGAVSTVVSDAHGTPVAVVANTNWSLNSVKRIYTEPFGAQRGTVSDAARDKQFLGAPRDATGLTLLGARYYDEAVGQFISTDPLLDPGTPAQFNAYVYSANNPMTWSDPSGLFWGKLFAGIGKLKKAWNKGVSNWKAGLNRVGKALNQAGKAVGDWVDKNKAEIIGVAVGIAVTAGCLAITAGAGSIGCAVLGGAAGGAASNLAKVHFGEATFSWSSLATDTIMGGATGLIGGGIGKAVLKLGGAVAKGAFGNASRAVAESSKTAMDAVGPKAAQVASKTGSKGSGVTSDATRGAPAASPIPSGPGSQKAWKVLDQVNAKDQNVPGWKGGQTWKNRDGILPTMDKSGKPVNYREWDINPPTPKGVTRGPERLVTGSDGTAYETFDHYQTFLRIQG